MRKFIWIIPLLILMLPMTGRGAPIEYKLHISVDPEEKKLTGSADISAASETALQLSVGSLYNLKVNGKDIVRDLDDTITVSTGKNRKTIVTYEADLRHAVSSTIDSEHVFLGGNWYPAPPSLVVYHLSATLPKNFIAVAAADSIRSESDAGTVTYRFQFEHPLDGLHLAASSRYAVSRDSYKNITLETYFFKEDAALAAEYLSFAKEYLKMFESMLTPYPYKRFAVVEHVLPAGYSMPTFTLLGQEVIHLPFIVRTSLGHEVLHQWFGNSVYLDLSGGNWVEGLTTYLSDHHLAELGNEGKAYRKQIMVDYAAYVKQESALPLSDFFFKSDKAQSVVGYGKSAMLFHDLRKKLGDVYFFTALQNLVQEKQYTRASWMDIQTSFEKVTGRDLSAYFDRWLHAEDIPRLEVEAAELVARNGELMIQFNLLQSSPPYPLTIPVCIYFEKGARIHFIETDDARKTVRLPVPDLPTRVVVDEDYDIMRQLTPDETPPVLAYFLGSESLTVAVSIKDKETYSPLINALGVKQVKFISPNRLSLARVDDSALLVAGYQNELMKMIAGKMEVPENGVYLNVIHNPFHPAKRILMAHVSHAEEALAIQKKLPHYGKYSELVFSRGKISHKCIAEAEQGISVWRHTKPKVVNASHLPTIGQIIPELMKSRIIYIGEQHDQFAHHINQLLIIKKLNESGLQLAVGMEMFKKPFQNIIDDYMAGRIDERQFLESSRYFSEWSYNYHLYKPIVDYLKRHRIPLVALNLESDITGLVARKGMDGLGEDQKQQIPEAIDFTDKQYVDDLKEVYAFHGGQNELSEFSHFLEAQVLWDESMADAAHAFLKTAPDYTLIVLAGNGHFRYRYGIPERLYRRNREPFVTVLQDEPIQKDIADYILFTQKLAVQETPKLGVSLKETKDGLSVKTVVNQSPAEEAGVKKEDIISKFDTHPIQTLSDLRLALFYAEYGNSYDLGLKRNNESITLRVKLFDVQATPDSP